MHPLYIVQEAPAYHQYLSALISATAGAIAAFAFAIFVQRKEQRREIVRAKQVLHYFFNSYIQKLEHHEADEGYTFDFDQTRCIALCDQHVLGCKDHKLVSDYLNLLDILNFGHKDLFELDIVKERAWVMRQLIIKHDLGSFGPK